MKVLVIGSGAREHALGWKLHLSPLVQHIYFAPGNAGTASIGTNLSLNSGSPEELVRQVHHLGIELTVVGPETPLASGLVDTFVAHGLKVFGPSHAAAQIEASKAFARELMASAGIPGPSFAIFDQPTAAISHVERAPLPLVVKADGLAGGKGARVCFTRREAVQAVEEIMVQRTFGPAGDKIVVEDFVHGREASALAFVYGDQVVLMPPARDYKRLLDGDQGPNTGGMGAICPIPEDSPELRQSIVERVLLPAVKSLLYRGVHYQGVLYAGLMLTSEGPQVLEFNCRFGDPEAQAILPLMASDLVEVIEACMAGKLDTLSLTWQYRHACAVVLASAGYPDSFRTGMTIEGLDSVEAPDRWAFHAGTARAGSRFVTAGGRVLTVVAVADTAWQARQKAYSGASVVTFEGVHFRRDIGL